MSAELRHALAPAAVAVAVAVTVAVVVVIAVDVLAPKSVDCEGPVRRLELVDRDRLRVSRVHLDHRPRPCVGTDASRRDPCTHVHRWETRECIAVLLHARNPVMLHVGGRRSSRPLDTLSIASS